MRLQFRPIDYRRSFRRLQTMVESSRANSLGNCSLTYVSHWTFPRYLRPFLLRPYCDNLKRWTPFEKFVQLYNWTFSFRRLPQSRHNFWIFFGVHFTHDVLLINLERRAKKGRDQAGDFALCASCETLMRIWGGCSLGIWIQKAILPGPIGPFDPLAQIPMTMTEGSPEIFSRSPFNKYNSAG